MNILNALSLKVVALVGVAALGLTACGGYGGATGTNAANPNTANRGDTVSSQSIGGMNVLVDSHGSVLYSPDQERSGKVLCTAGCTAIWQPLTVSGSASLKSSLGKDVGVIKRPDGGKQVTFKGRRLYSFTEERPGQVTGDNFKDSFSGTDFTWHAVLASGQSGSSSATSNAPRGTPGGY
jgi:predicted lipoprotein with Yx(FWY)xxD motif